VISLYACQPLNLILFVCLLLTCRFSVSDDLRDGYTYAVGICTHAQAPGDRQFNNAGAVQVEKGSNTQHRIGSYEQAQIMSGSMFTFPFVL